MADRRRAACFGAVFTMLLAGFGWGACSGPVSLSRAVWPRHEQEFRRVIASHPESPRESWYAWEARRHGITVERARQRDERISTTRNPFDANHDAEAVSRGAVIYRTYCQRCHGQEARGDGPDILPDHAPPNLHAFPRRFAVTLHKGAPRTWFRVIDEGFGDQVAYPDGPSRAMPAFGDVLAHEQIWLVITYLQSLDVYHRPAPVPAETRSQEHPHDRSETTNEHDR